jgi:tRNA(His) guanylyltransferase
MRFCALSERMKAYESVNDAKIDAKQPVVIRLDGRAFSNFTKQTAFEQPFCMRFASAMKYTAQDLLDEFRPDAAYTSSDEISLFWDGLSDEDEKRGRGFIFSGRVQKLVSLIAAFASVRFNLHLSEVLDETTTLATFDARIFNVPTREEAANCLRWRCFRDAVRNSKQKLGQFYLGKRATHGLNTDEIIERVLKEHDVAWSDLEGHIKYGTLFRKEVKQLINLFTDEEYERGVTVDVPIREEHFFGGIGSTIALIFGSN